MDRKKDLRIDRSLGRRENRTLDSHLQDINLSLAAANRYDSAAQIVHSHTTHMNSVIRLQMLVISWVYINGQYAIIRSECNSTSSYPADQSRESLSIQCSWCARAVVVAEPPWLASQPQRWECEAVVKGHQELARLRNRLGLPR